LSQIADLINATMIELICQPWVEGELPVLPRCLAVSADASSNQQQHVCLSQDSALAHHTCDTIQLLQHETPDFIGRDVWPPNNPYLNPVDYKIWRVVQRLVCRPKCGVINVDELKQLLVEVMWDHWDDMQQTLIDSAVSQWRQRLKLCVRTQGQHFEHLL